MAYLSGTVLLPCMNCWASSPRGVFFCTSACSRSPAFMCGTPNLQQSTCKRGEHTCHLVLLLTGLTAYRVHGKADASSLHYW